MRKWIGALIVAAAVVFSAGPGSTTARAATFVGRVQGSDAYIAVLKDGRKIGGYLCDNGTVSRWIEYRWLRKGVAPLLVGTTGERLGSVRIAGKSATGTVVIAGQKRRFRAALTSKADGGLHFAIGKQPGRLLVAGWILLPDGSQRGAVSRVNTQTLSTLPTTSAPRLDFKATKVPIGGDTNVPPVNTEPVQLVVINIIAILIGLLVPAVQ
jgi:hypothetical protein